MTSTDDPEWQNSGVTRVTYTPHYQLKGAQTVRLGDEDTWSNAIQMAVAGLEKALKKAIEIGLKIEGSCWVVRTEYRGQVRSFDPSGIQEKVTCYWHGGSQLTVASKQAAIDMGKWDDDED